MQNYWTHEAETDPDLASLRRQLAMIDHDLWLCQTALEFGRLGIFNQQEVTRIVAPEEEGE